MAVDPRNGLSGGRPPPLPPRRQSPPPLSSRAAQVRRSFLGRKNSKQPARPGIGVLTPGELEAYKDLLM
ncbi:MAG: hypothetical protein QGF59_23885, partial [Pirellulaceae bacterium]|nr:hypothetical protein [Pirellulaceae bacterium]